MTDRDRAREIKTVGWCERADVVGRDGHVPECARPATALVTQPSILDVPGRDSGGRQCRGEWPHVVQGHCLRRILAEPRKPAAAMDYDRHRMRPLRWWDSQ